MQDVDLAGTWHLAKAGGGAKAPMQVPGDIVSALVAAGLLPDPYFGRNEYECRWVCEADWIVSRSFDLDDTDRVLVIDGLDTVAEVSVNGTVVLSCANAFRRWEADISGVARKGENRIEILFRSPLEAGRLLQETQPFFVPYHAGNSPLPNGNMLRKPQCDFGWDWNIALASSGIWNSIELQPKRESRIRDLLVSQHHHEDGSVTLQVRADLEAAGGPQPVVFRFGGMAVQATCDDPQATFTIAKPELWWPVGLGKQTLHELEVGFAGQTQKRRIGLRDIRLISETDAAGRSFTFNVNGCDVFARGANWIPADALSGRIAREDVRGLLQSAVDANMNMIRVWGGGRYEPDWFYDLCDELGLMVWQDFMFACNLYPSTPAFLAEIDREVRDVVTRLHHHASIALWCGDNELIGALTWFEESRTDRDRYLVSYDRLNRTVETALLEVAPDANWWPSSPSPGPMSFGDAWHDDSSGDMHFWSVWHEGKDFDHYRDVSPRFCSEFGFQSYPSMDVVRRFASPDDMNIASPVMESHQKNAGGNARIAETMFRYFRFPVDFENFVYLSQVQQGVAIKTAVTHWRSLKPHCMGTLIWQLNDTWPVCSWSSLDHGGGWKLLHHMAKRFFEPVTVVIVPEEGALVLKAINDTANDTHIVLEVSALTTVGKTRSLGKAEQHAGTDAATILLEIEPGTLADNEMLVWQWTDADGRAGGDIFAPKPFKAYDLHAPHITLETRKSASGWALTISASTPAFFVSIEADVPGRFSNNAFMLFPGFSADISFVPADPSAEPSFVVRDLHSATHANVA